MSMLNTENIAVCISDDAFPSNQICRHCKEAPIVRGESLCRVCFLTLDDNEYDEEEEEEEDDDDNGDDNGDEEVTTV
jgi:predicted amidophosphoribosyltransferase